MSLDIGESRAIRGKAGYLWEDVRNAAHAAFTIVREEGLGTLYRGVTLTALRQATNQGPFRFLPPFTV